MEEELQRLEQSLQAVLAQTHAMIDQATLAEEQSKVDILEAYCMLIEDPAVTQSSKEYIRDEKYNAAHAVRQGMNQVIEIFEGMDDDYMRERACDIRDIQQRLLEHLLGVERQDLGTLAPNTIRAC